MSDETVFIINPLTSTLCHYERELVDTLSVAGHDRVEVIPTIEGEGVTTAAQRLRIAAASLLERARLGFSVRGHVIIVLWPMFGYLDPWTLWGLCRRNRVLIVFHDPTPLDRLHGYSRLPRRLFKWVVAVSNTEIIYHTELAQQTGAEACGIAGMVVPHPLNAGSSERRAMPSSPELPYKIRVLGQYKATRAVASLEEIAAKNSDQLRLEIHGRGWPAVAGWTVSDGFVPEAKFDELIRSSDCVVIPYDAFFQSGVAVRCLENGVPIVAPRHEHIVELYGSDWPGLVRDANDWHSAVLRAIAADSNELSMRAEEARKEVGRRWKKVLNC